MAVDGLDVELVHLQRMNYVITMRLRRCVLPYEAELGCSDGLADAAGSTNQHTTS